MPISSDELDRRFDFHPATGATGPVHAEIRRLHRELANDVVRLVPEGREQSLAITKIEESMYWANAGIARLSE